MIKVHRLILIMRNAIILSGLYRIIWFWIFPPPEMPVYYTILMQLAAFVPPIATLYLAQLISIFCMKRKGVKPEKLPQNRMFLYSLLASVPVTAICVTPIFRLIMLIFMPITG